MSLHLKAASIHTIQITLEAVSKIMMLDQNEIYFNSSTWHFKFVCIVVISRGINPIWWAEKGTKLHIYFMCYQSL